MWRRMQTSALALLVMLGNPSASISQGIIRGEARVVDGDTLRVGLEPERLRLKDIDALELSQSCVRPSGEMWLCGQASKQALIMLIDGLEVSCRATERDKYQRWLVTCGTMDVPDLGAAMVQQGWALVWHRSFAGTLAALQQEAVQAKRGIWGSTFQMPWDYRHPVPKR